MALKPGAVPGLVQGAVKKDGGAAAARHVGVQGALSSCLSWRAWTRQEARILPDGCVSATHSGLSDILPGGMCLRAKLSVGGGGQSVSTGPEVVGDCAERDQKNVARARLT
jgi:hypothetical protein